MRCGEPVVDPTRRSEEELQEDGGKTDLGAVGRWLVQAFAWHLRLFLTANVALGLVNWLTGGPWWALWPLLATGLLLAVHYLFYRAAAADERWVEERVQELNLKSYDRSHIEDLKARHGGPSDPGSDQRS